MTLTHQKETVYDVLSLSSYDVERTGKGHDYKRVQRNIITGSKKTEYIEVKSGDAKLSPLQKKTKKKKRNYKVVREDPLLF